MKLKLLACAAVALLAAAPAVASANVETFSETIPNSTVPFTFNFTLPAFNAALGQLTGVSITLDDTTVTDIEVVNLTAAPQSFTGAFATIPLTLTGPNGLSMTTSVTAGPIAGSVTSDFITQFPGNSGSDTATVTLSGSQLSFFETPPAGSDLDFSAASLTGTFGGSGPQGVLFGGTAQVTGSADITYTFTPLPETATWALMLVGFGGMGGVLRHRRRLTLAD